MASSNNNKDPTRACKDSLALFANMTTVTLLGSLLTPDVLNLLQASNPTTAPHTMARWGAILPLGFLLGIYRRITTSDKDHSFFLTITTYMRMFAGCFFFYMVYKGIAPPIFFAQGLLDLGFGIHGWLLLPSVQVSDPSDRVYTIFSPTIIMSLGCGVYEAGLFGKAWYDPSSFDTAFSTHSITGPGSSVVFSTIFYSLGCLIALGYTLIPAYFALLYKVQWGELAEAQARYRLVIGLLAFACLKIPFSGTFPAALSSLVYYFLASGTAIFCASVFEQVS